MMTKEEIDYKLIAEQLRTGKPLFGKDGALEPMLERILNAALEGEVDAHLSDESRSSGNRCNGKMPKTVQTQYGEVTVETPRDRDGSFDPQTVRKRETILAEGMADQIIGMYAFGTSTREISKYFEREFNTKLSAETISAITDRVLPELKEWKSRSLDPVYAICWLDAVHYKINDDSGRAVTRAVYNVLGVNKEGRKELLGMYVARSKGACRSISSIPGKSAVSSIPPLPSKAITVRSARSRRTRACSPLIRLWKNWFIWPIAISVRSGPCRCQIERSSLNDWR